MYASIYWLRHSHTTLLVLLRRVQPPHVTLKQNLQFPEMLQMLQMLQSL